ncbi:MAG: hypothetical protein ABIO16_03690 [Nocardioides sp.]
MPQNPRSAFLVVTALAVVGLPLLTVASAQGVSASLSYHCTTSPNVGEYDVSAVVDTNAPTTLGSGLAAPIIVTSDVTVPATVTALLTSLGATNVSGTSSTTGTVDGVARTSTLAIPKTAVPPPGPMHVIGTGPGGTITGGNAGTSILLGAGNFTATLTGYDDAGNVKVAATTFTCALTPPTGQNLLVDTVNVVSTPTTTTLSIKPAPIEYGDTTTVSADVSQPGGNQKPAGTIVFTYAGKTYPVTVKGGKASVALPASLTLGANQVTSVFTPTDKNLAASQAAASFSVTRGSTTTTGTVAYRDVTHRFVAKALVESVHGTEVAGKVRFTLKRDGVKIRSAIVSLNAKDKAKKVFQHIRKPGTYVAVAKYLGSSTLRRSKGSVRLVVRTP